MCARCFRVLRLYVLQVVEPNSRTCPTLTTSEPPTAGPRQSTVAVLPRGATTVSWQLVPVAAGSLALPAVRISAPRLDAALDASAGRRVFVAPPTAA